MPLFRDWTSLVMTKLQRDGKRDGVMFLLSSFVGENHSPPTSLTLHRSFLLLHRSIVRIDERVILKWCISARLATNTD